MHVDEVIKRYFDQGLKYAEIVDFLRIDYGITLTVRQLKYRLAKGGHFRRKNHSDIEDVIRFIHYQLQGSSQMFGYRFMHKKCMENNLRIPRHTVRLILRELDPNGVQLRKRRRLRRREYNGKGPNNIWHIDSYDKLKRYGICINGCIDGYSRKLIWLEATTNTSNPLIIGGHYITSVQKLGGCPRIVRVDRGTENFRLGDMQRWLRRNGADSFAGDNSLMYSRSTANQRIEQYWSFLRKNWTQFWLNIFNDLAAEGKFTGSWLDKNLIRLVFLRQVQVKIYFTGI